MGEKRRVSSIFDAEAGADEAAATLHQVGALVDDAIGVLALDERGKLKTHKGRRDERRRGRRRLGLSSASWGHRLRPGTAGGALLGKLHHKDLGLDDADRGRLGAALRGGQAAVGVLAGADELVAVESILVGRGGEKGTRTRRGRPARCRRERSRLTTGPAVRW